MGLGSSALVTTAFFHLKLITAMSVDYLMVIEYCFFTVYVLATVVIFIAMVNGHYDNLASKYAGEEGEGSEALVNNYRRRIQYLDWFGKLFHPALLLLLIIFFVHRYSILQTVFLSD